MASDFSLNMAGSRISRRVFAQTGLVLGSGALTPWRTFSQEENPAGLKDWQMASLEAALKDADERYDPEAKMLRGTSSSIGYHTTLDAGTPVHPTRSSFEYALALFDRGGEERLTRGLEMLETLIALQDQDPESGTYGIWSWYLEEPLDQMSPPDWNWADFCGSLLLAVWIDHRERLPEAMQEKVKTSIQHAARSIERRNVGPGYTNIAIMGTYVTLVTAEQFEIADLGEYAQQRLRRLYDFTKEQGSFSEYNSPTYTIVVIRELTRMRMHVQNEADQALIDELHDLAWQHAARRFHPPTQQWGGPHSRCYSTLLRDRDLALLEAATGRPGRLYEASPLPIGLGYYRLAYQCPEDYRPYYFELDEARTVRETFIQANPDRAGRRTPVVGTTGLTGRYCLGSINRGDLWRQRRAVVAYWGTPQHPRYFTIRFLHDGYDFSSALIFNVQSQGCLLSSVCFATNYGDTHISLDRVQDATIQAKDLRLRFEWGGSIDGIEVEEFKEPVHGWGILDGGFQIGLRPLGGVFGQEEWRWEQGGDEERQWIDAVAFEAKEEQPVNLANLALAWLAFTLEIHTQTSEERQFGATTVQVKDNALTADWRINGSDLKLSAPASPGPINRLFDMYRGEIVTPKADQG